MEIRLYEEDILKILKEKYPEKIIRFEQYGTDDSSSPYFMIEDKLTKDKD